MSSPQPELIEMESEQSDLDPEMSDTDSLAKKLRGVVIEEKEETVTNIIDHTDDNPELQRCVITPGSTKITREMELIMFNSQKAVIEDQLKKEKSEISKIQKVVTLKNRFIQILAEKYDTEICKHEEFIMDFEKESADAKTHFAEATKVKEQLDAVIEKLTDGTLEREFAEVEGILNKHKNYENLLFSLLLPQEAKTSKAKVLIDKDDQNEMNSQPQKTVVSKGLGRDLESSPGQVLPSPNEPTLSSAYSDTGVPDSTLDVNSTEYEKYFSNPQQMVGLLSDLTDQNLSQIQNATRRDNILDQTIELASEKMKELEERLPLLVRNMKDKIVREQERAVMLGKQIQLHEAVKIQDSDIMLDAVDKKVTEVLLCFADSRMTYLNITRKLCKVEYRMSLMLQQIESIPEERFKILKHIKDTEWRNRLREEALQQEIAKQKEKLAKSVRRSLAEAKKITGRKLMPRCFPVRQNIQVLEEAPVSPEVEDLNSYLFSEDSD